MSLIIYQHCSILLYCICITADQQKKISKNNRCNKAVLIMINSYYADSISRPVVPVVVSWLKFLRLALLIVSRRSTKPPKADLMSSHLSHHDCVVQTFLADYCASKNSCRSKAISSTIPATTSAQLCDTWQAHNKTPFEYV